MAKQYHYKCRSNPNAPLLTLGYWDAQEMKNHPDYDRVDELGLPIIEEDVEVPQQIPITTVKPKS